jgi:DNA polymerase theta
MELTDLNILDEL